MINNKINFVIILLSFFLATCSDSGEMTWEVEKIDYQVNFNMVKVPVPENGIDFPTGIDDNNTGRVEKAFYISDTPITKALWSTVSRWAAEREFANYPSLPIYRILADFDFPRTDPTASGYNPKWEYFGRISMFYVVPIWCNAFTEWYNEINGTNLIPVYQDSNGHPIRWLDNMTNFYGTANPNATGFRLPTSLEWELAARWNGSSKINTVTKTINNINFSNQEINFTTGRSASGARSQVNNFDENNRVAVWKNNSGFRLAVKSKEPNMLGIYDMSGNVLELTSTCGYGYLGSTDWYWVNCRGGSAESDYTDLSVGKIFNANYNRGSFEPIIEAGAVGFRVVRNVE